VQVPAQVVLVGKVVGPYYSLPDEVFPSDGRVGELGEPVPDLGRDSELGCVACGGIQRTGAGFAEDFSIWLCGMRRNSANRCWICGGFQHMAAWYEEEFSEPVLDLRKSSA